MKWNFSIPVVTATPWMFQTYIGPVLVSVNPYHELDIYNSDVIHSYKNVNFYELPPHVYVVNKLSGCLHKKFSTGWYNECRLLNHEVVVVTSGSRGVHPGHPPNYRRPMIFLCLNRLISSFFFVASFAFHVETTSLATPPLDKGHANPKVKSWICHWWVQVLLTPEFLIANVCFYKHGGM